MRIVNLLSIACVLVSVASCNDATDSLSDKQTNAELETFMSGTDFDNEEMDVSIAKAKSVANKFMKRNSNSLKRVSYRISERTISDPSTGQPLMYILNYGRNQGFAIVSANKNCPPILAFSNSGNFDETNDPTAKYMLNQYTIATKSVIEKNESLQSRYALQWASLENPVQTRTSLPYELREKIQAEIDRKVSLGYEHLGNISAASYFLPAFDYQALLEEMRDVTDPKYDYIEVNQFFIRSYNYESIGPLLTTQWHQNAPFNVDAPNGIAGCVPIAVAQTLYYYKFPDKYCWNFIPNTPTEYEIYNPDFVFFIKDVRNLLDVQYGENETGSNANKAVNAFKKLGYKVSEMGAPNNTNLYRSISARYPVILFGKRSSGSGHSWVCDGYENRKYEASISFVPSPDDKRFKFDHIPGSIFVEYDTHAYSPSWLDQEQFGEYFHMNMGWQGYNDGWYKYAIMGYYGEKDDLEAYDKDLNSICPYK